MLGANGWLRAWLASIGIDVAIYGATGVVLVSLKFYPFVPAHGGRAHTVNRSLEEPPTTSALRPGRAPGALPLVLPR